jgi:hypothetical protein
MSSKCPANDTDCLLRALIDTNSGYNWNPLNFAFTAALSVLGFVVASFTLMQGFLAAGPGRLKASRSAVGSAYSRKAHTRFDRTELRFRTLVRVPILDVDKLADMKVPHGGILVPLGSSSERSPLQAGWSRLLEDLGLETFPFETLPCPTDYLPDDVQAAPASATVESLVIMALLAGCENVHRAEGFLRLTGANIQLEFRSHQALGIVAGYQHYFTAGETPIDASLHPQSIHEARGRLRFKNEALFAFNTKHHQQVHINMTYDYLAENIDRQRSDCDHVDCASRMDPVTSWKDILREEKPNQIDIDKLTTLLFANKPTAARMFPTDAANFRWLLNRIGNLKYMWFHQITFLQTLQLLPKSEVLIGLRNIDEFDDTRKLELRNRDDSTWFNTRSTKQVRDLRSIALKIFRMHSLDTRILTEDSIVVSNQALDLCFAWLDNGDLFTTMELERRNMERENLMLQLREVDWWLSTHGKSDALCSALNMINAVRGGAPLGAGAENIHQPDNRSIHDHDANSDVDNNDAGSNMDNEDAESHHEDHTKSRHDIDADSDLRNNEEKTPGRKLGTKTGVTPTFAKVHRKYISPVTLNHYGLPWEYDKVW